MTVQRVPEASRSDERAVTAATHPAPMPSPYPGPFPPPGPGGPSQRPIDPVTLAAEWEVRLTHQGSPPGPGYRRAALVDVARLALAALDIPSVEDSGDHLAETRRAVRRVRALAGGAR